jgi:hypothetical protein
VRLIEQLRPLRAEAFAREREQARAERRLAALQSRLAQLIATPPAVSKPAPSPRDPNLYVWDEHSPYVRVPKQVLGQLRFAPTLTGTIYTAPLAGKQVQVRFAPFATRLGRDGKTERYQLPPLAADGTPQPALEAALGLSADEAGRLREICQGSFAEFNALAASHSQLKEEPFAGGTMASVKLSTSAFAEEGAQFRDEFKGRIADLLGPERAEAFWSQAAPLFTELFNDFGAYPRDLQLVNNPNAGLELFNTYRGGGSVGPLSQRNGTPLPQGLQAYADAWTREQAGQAATPSPP